MKKRPDEDRDITIVCLGKELAVDAWIDEWNKKHPVNKIKVIELKTDKKYGNFLIHKPAEAKVKIERKDKNKAIIEIQDFISPTIIERLNIDNKLFKVKIPDFRSMIDTVLINNNYNGKTFHIVYSDVPQKKQDLVKGKYEIEISSNKTRIGVKINRYVRRRNHCNKGSIIMTINFKIYTTNLLIWIYFNLLKYTPL